MNFSKVMSSVALCVVLAFGLVACGSGGDGGGGKKKVAKYTIGGIVNGLAGSGLVLLNNGGDDLAIINSGAFAFANKVANGKDYSVTVLTQPSTPNQICTVNNGTGMVNSADVTDVTVTCSTNAYTIGGTASGITNTVVLQNNGSDDLIINATGPFTFTTPVADTAGYVVTILSSPGLGCSLTNSSGTVSGSDVTDVALSCSEVSVEALYPNNGANWNDYVKGGNITNATDTACDAATDSACIHAGEIHSVEVPGVYSCDGVTATDTLGAFDWMCDDSTSPVRMVSTGLKDGKHLSDLLDFDTLVWKEDSVTVKDGGTVNLQTPSVTWWGNPIELDNYGGILNSTGTIYVVTGTAVTPDYIINATSVGLVGAPGAIMNANASTSFAMIYANGSVTPKDFLWVEGVVNSGGANNCGVEMFNTRFLRFDNLTSNDSGNTGIKLVDSAHNMLTGVTASNNTTDGLYLEGATYNTLSDITASNNSGNGLYFFASTSSTFSEVTASNNGVCGVFLYTSSNNTLSGITASNNSYGVDLYASAFNTLSGITVSNNNIYGVHFDSSANNMFSRVTASNNNFNGVDLLVSYNNTFSEVSASNNGNAGVYVDGSHDNTFSEVTASNNANAGVYVNGSYDNTFSNVAASNNAIEGVGLYSTSNNYFTGILKVGSNASDDCSVSGGTNPGLVNTTCTTNGFYGSSDYGGALVNSSDATLYNGVDLSSSFVGKIYDDGVNADATGSAVSYPADPSTFDWSNFESHYRGWGLDGIFGDAGSQGQWYTGNGAIWDWSVSALDAGEYDGSPAILGVLGMPTGDDTLTHGWFVFASNQSECDALMPGSVFVASNDCETTFLRNAVEIMGDSIGNDNLLCESDETCLFTPNIGSYQGHGNLVDATDGAGFTDGTLPGSITDVILKEYETNGR